MSTHIPEAMVPATYINDPATEDLIFGDKLRNGMVVLLEDGRGDPSRLEKAAYAERNNILATTRWCRVDDLRFERGMATFIAAYSDGTKQRRSYNVTSYAWFVKKTSMRSKRFGKRV